MVQSFVHHEEHLLHLVCGFFSFVSPIASRTVEDLLGSSDLDRLMVAHMLASSATQQELVLGSRFTYYFA